MAMSFLFFAYISVIVFVNVGSESDLGQIKVNKYRPKAWHQIFPRSNEESQPLDLASVVEQPKATNLEVLKDIGTIRDSNDYIRTKRLKNNYYHRSMEHLNSMWKYEGGYTEMYKKDEKSDGSNFKDLVSSDKKQFTTEKKELPAQAAFMIGTDEVNETANTSRDGLTTNLNEFIDTSANVVKIQNNTKNNPEMITQSPHSNQKEKAMEYILSILNRFNVSEHNYTNNVSDKGINNDIGYTKIIVPMIKIKENKVFLTDEKLELEDILDQTTRYLKDILFPKRFVYIDDNLIVKGENWRDIKVDNGAAKKKISFDNIQKIIFRQNKFSPGYEFFIMHKK